MMKAPLIIKLLVFIVSFVGSTAYCQSELWGLTAVGGDFNGGTIFKVDENGLNHQVIHSFELEVMGTSPFGSLIEATNGKYYGLTANGGIGSPNGWGVLFEYDPITSVYKALVSFDGVDKGMVPFGSLLEASNGKLYGMTNRGGLYDKGVIFEYDVTSQTFNKKIDFDGVTMGATPLAAMIQSSNGMLYGMTSEGGIDNKGVLFEYDPLTNVIIRKVSFKSEINSGVTPEGSLTEHSNGLLYGLTRHGSAGGNLGTLFEFNPVNADFTQLATGIGDLYGDLIEAQNGNLYGLSYSGGDGKIFEYDPIGNVLQTKHSFDGVNGSAPKGSLIEHTNGILYGMTESGGTNDLGVIFNYDPINEIFNKVYDFDGVISGDSPVGNLIESSSGKLIGLTYSGGIYNRGVLFEYNTSNNTLTKKLDFNQALNGKGYNEGGLTLGPNDRLFGMSSDAGLNNLGTLYEIDINTNVFIKRLDFDGMLYGSQPFGKLCLANDGMLYGVTWSGGTNDFGVLFQYDPVGNVMTKKIDFDGTLNGSNPRIGVIEASNNKMYGLTETGGVNDMGTLFEYDPVNNLLVKKVDFNGLLLGSQPRNLLTESSNGKLYGLTKFGGVSGDGVVFEYDYSTDQIIKKDDFDGSNLGSYPHGSLVETQSGVLYGSSYSGGATGDGTIFSYDLASGLLSKLIDLDTSIGTHPQSSLIESQNNVLYGTIPSSDNGGILFKFNTGTNILTTAQNFTDVISGMVPQGDLVFIKKISSETDILTFSFSEQIGTATPNLGNHTVAIEVANGTDVTSLTPTFTLSPEASATINAVAQVSGATSNDFTSQVTYSILAEDGITTQDWIVTITVDDGLVAYYPFNSNANDESGNGNHGAEVVGPVLAEDRFGNLNSAYWFDGESDYIELSSNTSLLSITDAPYTFSAWITLDIQNNNQKGILTGHNNSSGGFSGLLVKTTNNNVSFSMGSEEVYSSTLVTPNDTWYHVVGTHDAINGRIYVNGIESGIFTINNGSETSDILRIGKSTDDISIKGLTGRIDDVKIFNRSLEDTEIQSMYAEGGWPLTSNETDLLTFTLPEQTTPATIDPVNHTVDIEVVYGTDVTTLIPTFTLSTGASATVSAVAQVSGTTTNDFTTPVTYTVRAEDGITTKDWEVTVSYGPNSATDILSFTISPQIGLTSIDANAHTIILEIISGPSIALLIPKIELSYGATVNPPSDVVDDFTNPISYLVTAEDGLTTQAWLVTVNINSTVEPDILTDIDGNQYTTVKIGNQWWMGVNLRTTHYADGTSLVDGTLAGIITGDYTTKYQFAVNDDTSKPNTDKYSYLYTWAAAMNGSETSKAQGVCPTGWHLPSDLEWQELEMHLGLSQVEAESVGFRGTNEGGILKEVGLAIWNAPNTGATNEKGFRALPAGQRGNDGSFGGIGDEGGFWTSDLVNSSQAWGRDLNTTSASINRGAPEKDIGFSVRCIEDRSSETDILTFSLPEQISPAIIDVVNHIIDIEVDLGTNVTSLIPTLTLSTGAFTTVNAVDQVSGTTANDYTLPITYTVMAEDGATTQDWVVTVTVAQNIETDILNFTLPEETNPAAVDAINHIIDIEVTFGTDVTSLIPTFALSTGASAIVSSVNQISGTTLIDFTNPVTYTITAEDGVNTQDWVVTVFVDDGLVAYYPFNSNVLDESGNLNHGTENGGVALTSDRLGNTNSAFSFDGVDDNISIAGTSSHKISQSRAFAFTGWFLFDGSSQSSLIQNDINWLFIEPEGESLVFHLPADTGADGPEWQSNDLNKWTYFAATFDGTTARLYIDGIEVASMALSVSIIENQVMWPINLGQTGDGDYPFMGKLDEIRVYNRTLSVSEIQSIYIEGLNNKTDILTFSLPEQTSTAILDAVSHTIDIDVPYGTNLLSLIPTFTLSSGATVNVNTVPQASGTTPNDFTNSVTYTTTAEDGTTTQDWTVNVTVALNSATDILAFSFPEQTGAAIINATTHRVEIEVANGTNTLSLIPTFALSPGASVFVNTVLQVNGTTANDFSGPVTYDVLAEDGLTSFGWEIAVSVQEDLVNPEISASILPNLMPSGSSGEQASITVTDNAGLSAVTFYSKLSNADSFNSQLLTTSNDTYAFNITESMVTDVGLEYFFLAEDNNQNNASSDTVQIVIEYTANNGPTIPNLGVGGNAEGWRMFSIPFILDDKKVATHFEVPLGTYDESKWRIVHYKNDTERFVEYRNGLSVVERGKGYWFNSVQPATIPMSPGKAPSNTKGNLATLTIQAGWNQIGNPYTFDVSWAEVISHNGITNEVETSIRVFEDGISLVNSTVLKAFSGAYLKADQPIILEVPLLANIGGRLSGKNEFDQGWLLSLNLEAGLFSNTVSGLGMHPDALLTNDRFDQIRSPRFANYIDATFEHPEYFMPNFSRDIAPEQENFTWVFTITTNVEDPIRTITWNNLQFDRSKKLMLVDLTNYNVIDMLRNNLYSYSADNSRKFKVIFGNEDYLFKQFNENNVYLGENYPNPFNHNTTIPYSVFGKEDSYFVKINIYSINGTLIKTLVNKAVASGIYTVEWNGEDNSSQKLSGMFIYSLEVTTSDGLELFRKKMIVR